MPFCSIRTYITHESVEINVNGIDVLGDEDITLFLITENYPKLFFQTSELGVTEHIEGDECKLAVWTGRAPISDYRIVLKVGTLTLISFIYGCMLAILTHHPIFVGF